MALDRNALDELRALDPDGSSGLLAQIVQSYLDDTASIFSKLKTSMAAGDTTTMTREAHLLKSTSRSVGALQLGEMAFSMEKIGRSGSIDGCAELLNTMLAEFKQVEPELLGLAKPA